MDVAVDLSGAVLETGRLALRGWRWEDLGDLYSYASVEGVGEMAGWEPHESIEVSRGVLEFFIGGKSELAIEEKESGRVIGSVGLYWSWANEDGEYAGLKVKNIGFVLAKDRWGRGLMTEAVRALAAHCFEACGLDALTCGHMPGNTRSQRVIEKCGFRYVKQNTYHDAGLGMTFSGRRYILWHDSR